MSQVMLTMGGDHHDGRRLFGNLPPEHIELDLVRTLEAHRTLHLRCQVKRQP